MCAVETSTPIKPRLWGTDSVEDSAFVRQNIPRVEQRKPPTAAIDEIPKLGKQTEETAFSSVILLWTVDFNTLYELLMTNCAICNGFYLTWKKVLDSADSLSNTHPSTPPTHRTTVYLSLTLILRYRWDCGRSCWQLNLCQPISSPSHLPHHDEQYGYSSTKWTTKWTKKVLTNKGWRQCSP